ncbi:cAMP-binding domain of CRP or a regulatory subunit of cAMP-dependent protein kinases [Chryseobacterium arachidis]|uniref:cAMP-binding domain of CRP or a regulatory subunit of cAMP-dependent protein kinases n=1 Tax=Chryseobacterium arachidis TaxID=1416778 RepID=A0A1M5GBK7_9FLAO|nr:Crp/Fnr family transcriptional regulator [Chryseobacterium arachidis]SHG00861.1 cAMP-binding domain of CRP or a regulatory subunit of cAMP-dependent protein kinases [Chryseobacterium arachidis]
MVINEDILHSVGANIKEYKASENIFNEGDYPNYYYQIITGEVKLNNYNEDGKESIQTLLESGESIGESMLFMDKHYPMNATAITNCEIFKLPKHVFFNLLKECPEISQDINVFLSQRVYYGLIMSQNLGNQNPAAKLKTLMDYLKSFQEEQSPYSFRVPLTRQQMASLTGLCVETTIRTIKGMERDQLVRIKDRKILY